MQLIAQIKEYEMGQVILDLGSDVNVLPKKMWERMGKPALQLSPIQLRMTNQKKILPMERLQGVTMDIEGVSTQTNFKVIEIVDDSNPYPTLLGIDWAMDMNGVIDLKRQKMTFEKNSLCVIVPLDLTEGVPYTKPVHDENNDDELDCIYQMTT